MRAYIIPAGNTALDGLRRVDRPDPQPRAGQVLVRVRAASLNRRDQAVITGTYFGKPVARDTIPLSDGAGEVAAVGEGVTRFEPGDRVVATYLQTPPDGPPFADQASLGFPLDGTLADQIVLYENGLLADPGRPLLRRSGLPAVRGRHGLECADGCGQARQGRRHGARARHRRRVDVRAAVRPRRRRARHRHLVERREDRAGQGTRCVGRRELHAHARLAQGSPETHRRTRRGLRGRSGRRRHARAIVRFTRDGRQGRSDRRAHRTQGGDQPVRVDVEGRHAARHQGWRSAHVRADEPRDRGEPDPAGHRQGVSVRRCHRRLPASGVEPFIGKIVVRM